MIEPNIYFKQKLLVLAHHINMKQLHIPLSIHTYKNLRKKFLPAAGFFVQNLILCVDLFLCLFPLRKSFWVAARLFKAVLLPACSTDQFLFVCVCFLACVFLGVYVFV